jgi:hypothetical protein
LNRVVRASDPADDAPEPRRVLSPRTWYGWLSVLQPYTPDGGAASPVPHTIGWLPPAPPVNREPVELYLWSPLPVDEALEAGLPVDEPYLLLYPDAQRLAARKRTGHLLSVTVPTGTAVDLFELDTPLPAVLRHRIGDEPDTYLLPLAWLSGVTVTAGYDLDGSGAFAAAHRVGGRRLSVLSRVIDED